MKKETTDKTQFSEAYELLNPENIERLQAEAPDKEPDEITLPEDDLLITDAMRRLLRNNSQVKGWMFQLFVNTIGTGQKPIFNSKSKEFNELAKELYRKKSKNWEGRDDKNRYLCNELTFKTAYAEGQIFAYYDAAGIIRKGKWFYWKREYMPMINKSDFKEHENKIRKIVKAEKHEDIKQVKGLIVNGWGVTKGYIICKKPGLGEAKYDPNNRERNKITIIPHDRNTKLVKFTEEMNAKHGVSMLIALAEEGGDMGESVRNHTNALNSLISLAKQRNSKLDNMITLLSKKGKMTV